MGIFQRIQRLNDRVFGFDFFISYGWRDAQAYATNLRDELTKHDVRCFQDTREFQPGEPLGAATLHNLKKSTALILIGTPAAISSMYVRNEIKEFAGLGRLLIPVDVGAALQNLDDSEFEAILGDRLRLVESSEALSTGPSDHLIARLLQGITFTRQSTRRLRIFGTAALTFAAIAAFAVMAALWARHEAKVALSRQLAAQGLALAAYQQDRGLAACIKAYQTWPTVEARSALLNSLQAHPQIMFCLHGGKNPIAKLAISSDGTLLAAAGLKEPIRLWDVQTGRLMAELPLRYVPDVTDLCFSRDRIEFAACTSDGVIYRWRVNALAATPSRYKIPLCSSIGYLSGHNTLLVGGTDGSLSALQADGSLQKLKTPHTGLVTSIAIARNGRFFFTSSMEPSHNVVMWDAVTLKPLSRTFHKHASSVNYVAVSSDGSTAATAGEDRTVTLWDVATGAVREVLSPGVPLASEITLSQDNGTSAASVAFSDDGKYLVSVYKDGLTVVWDVTRHPASGQAIRACVGGVSSVAFCSGSHRFASAGKDAVIRLWNLDSVSPLATPFNGDIDNVHLSFTQTGQELLALSGKTLYRWNVTTKKQGPSAVLTHDPSSSGIAISPNGRWVALSRTEGQKPDYQLSIHTTTQPFTPIDIGDVKTSRAVFSPDSQSIAIFDSSSEGRLRLLDVTKRPASVCYFRGHKKGISCVGFSTNGQQLLSGDHAGSVLIWDMQKRKPSKTLDPIGRFDHATALAMDIRNNILACGYESGTLAIYDAIPPYRLRTVLPSHPKSVQAIAFTPDDTLMVSASSAGELVVWDCQTLQSLGTFWQWSDGYPSEMAFDPIGVRLASFGPAGINLWNLNSRDWISQATRISGYADTQGKRSETILNN